MNESNNNPSQKEEVVVLAGGVRARMMAYQQEIQRKEKAAKKNKPVFKVADDLGVSFHSNDGTPLKDKLPVQDDTELSASHGEMIAEEHAFQRSMNNSANFRGNALEELGESGVLEEEIEIEQEKPQEVKDEEEMVAKEKISRLLSRDEETEKEEDEAPVVLQAFSAVQRRYLRAIGKLRPEKLEIKKAEKEEEAPQTKEVIRKKLDREMTKSAHLTELTTTWDDYYEKAQDKPTEEAEVKQVEEEIKQVEEQVNTEWTNFAEQVIEQVVDIVGDDDDDSVKSEDSDMVKWREEARRLKAEAEERKKQKAAREERKKKRAQMAALRKKRAEEATSRKQAEVEAEAARLEAEAEAEAARKIQEATMKRLAAEQETKKAAEETRNKGAEVEGRKKADDSDSDSSASSDDSSSAGTPEPEPERKVSPKETKSAEQAVTAVAMPSMSAPSSPSTKKAPKQKVEKPDSDSDSSEDNQIRQTKKKSRKKKDRKEEREKERDVKDKDIVKVKEKKKKDKKKKGKKKGDDDSDLDDGWVEEYPRNFDGTLWRNPLKFWTNKPQKLNEVAPKVIMRPNPNSDVFCKSEDAINDNASFYWNKFQGDFNVLVKIKGSLKNSYDKAGIMVRQDERNWVMSGLEFFNQRINHSSCITRGISDWSLAPLPEEAKDGIWIAIKRHDNKVECFYSYDLKEWIQTRQGLFPTNQPLKVGIVAACPMGEPFKVVFERFRIQMVG